jgi:hypothetical protein
MYGRLCIKFPQSRMKGDTEPLVFLQETNILFNQTMNKKQIFNQIYNFKM